MIELEHAKLHLRVDDDEEDDLIQRYIDAATIAAAQHLNVPIVDLLGEDTPAPIDAAILLMVGDLYMNREAVVERQLFSNPTYDRLLAPYRVMAV